MSTSVIGFRPGFDVLSIEAEPVKLGGFSGTFHQRILNQRNEVCAEADVTWCCTNSNGKPARIPDESGSGTFPDGITAVNSLLITDTGDQNDQR